MFKDDRHTIAALSGKESATPSKKEATLLILRGGDGAAVSGDEDSCDGEWVAWIALWNVDHDDQEGSPTLLEGEIPQLG
jgi:hypothetical protein